MTDREKVIRLAEGVMGWKTRESCDKTRVFADTPDGATYIYGDVSSLVRRWNPLENIADAFEMQEKILANPRTDTDYLYRLNDMCAAGRAVFTTTGLMRFMISATPRQRCEAALAVLEK